MKKKLLKVEILEETKNLIEPLSKHLTNKLNMEITRDTVVALALKELHEKEMSNPF